jgi:hypothetical protein
VACSRPTDVSEASLRSVPGDRPSGRFDVHSRPANDSVLGRSRGQARRSHVEPARRRPSISRIQGCPSPGMPALGEFYPALRWVLPTRGRQRRCADVPRWRDALKDDAEDRRTYLRTHVPRSVLSWLHSTGGPRPEPSIWMDSRCKWGAFHLYISGHYEAPRSRALSTRAAAPAIQTTFS